MENGKKHSFEMKTPPAGDWHGHSYFHASETVLKRDHGGIIEYIGIHTRDDAKSGGTGIVFIPKASILEAAMLLFEIAEREGLTEIKEKTS